MTALYLDVETLPIGTLAHIAAGLTIDDPPAGWTAPAYPDAPSFDWKPGGNLKKAETIEDHRQAAHARYLEALRAHEVGRIEWPRTAARAEWDRRAGAPRADGKGREKGAALAPWHAEIACLAYAIDDAPVVVVGGYAALDVLADVFATHDPAIIVAHNPGFDAGMIRAAAIRAGADYLAGWIACWDYGAGREYGITKGPRWRDTQALACLGRAYVKQEDLASLLGVGRGHPIRGSEVFDAVMSGRMGEVMAHCCSDVEELRAMYLRLEALAEVRR